jgi:hypothetical protein
VNLIDPREKLQKDILRDVFNVFTSSEKTADQPEYHRGELIHDGFVRRSVACLSSNYELSIKFHTAIRRVDRRGYSFFPPVLPASKSCAASRVASHAEGWFANSLRRKSPGGAGIYFFLQVVGFPFSKHKFPKIGGRLPGVPRLKSRWEDDSYAFLRNTIDRGNEAK